LPPLRLLGYVLSACNVRTKYLPLSQLQVVFPLAAIEKINAVDAERSRVIAVASQKLLQAALQTRKTACTSSEDIIFVEALEVPDDKLSSFVARNLPEDLKFSDRLEQQANRRSTTAAAYVAAHLLVHDTHTKLLNIDTSGVAISTAERIVSIGAQSERPFYAARMACRRRAELPISLAQYTGQLFTRHVLPPYIACRQGEPDLSEMQRLQASTVNHEVLSVKRDLEFLQEQLGTIN
jgi:hypothetical protein